MRAAAVLVAFLLPGVGASVGATDGDVARGGGRRAEDSIPVVELRGEGKPMTAAQIRALEEAANGGPLDIKMEHTWRPTECPRTAKRKDFVTFHYKVFTEDGKKVHQTYGGDPVSIQLGVGMTLPGLDKGLKGMCDMELRKIRVPFRLAQRKKSKVWKQIPTDEHWIAFSVEMLNVTEYNHHRQFAFLDLNSDSFLDALELIKWTEKMKEFGKTWPNNDIDNVVAVNYYVKYFDGNRDGRVSEDEWRRVMERDEREADEKKSSAKGRRRDPGLAWILDFDNDGIVTFEEINEAADRLEKEPLRRSDRDEL